MPIPNEVNLNESEDRTEFFVGADVLAIMRTPSSTRPGKFHLTVMYKDKGELWNDCSCEGFQYTEMCKHCRALDDEYKEYLG